MAGSFSLSAKPPPSLVSFAAAALAAVKSELGIVHVRHVVGSAAKGAGVCCGKGFKDVF